MNPPWHVSIISTDDDLGDLRSVVIDEVRGYGFHVLAFEEPDFPTKPGLHSHDDCLAALKSADIVVLIIDKRYGGRYLLNDEISITEMEYETAVSNSKFIIPCVREKAWNECHTLALQIKKSGLTVDEFQHKNTPGTLDSWELYNFIHKVTHALKDNFTVFYTDPKDIVERIKGKLSGLSDYIIGLLVERSITYVESIKTTTALSLSLGDVLTNGYYVEPPYRIISGKAPSDCTSISEIVLDVLLHVDNVAVFGPPGIGKSTLLAKAFLAHAADFINSKTSYAPIFIRLRGLGPGYHFDVLGAVNDLIPQLINKAPYPLLDLSRVKFVFYIDAFDELTEDISAVNIDEIMAKSIFSWPFAVTSRTHFASNNLDVSAFGDKLKLIFKLEKWSPELAKKYVEHFCNSRSRHDLLPQFDKHFSDNANLDEIFDNPLLLTLFLLIVEEGDMALPLDVIDKSTLYSKAIYVWAKRDLNKKPPYLKSEEIIQKLIISWELIAWKIYRSRLDKKAIRLNEVISDIVQLLEFKQIITLQDVIITLLDIRLHSDKVVGFVHEELLEYLSARSVLSGFNSHKYPFPETLKYAIRSEINKFIIGNIRDYDVKQKDIILDVLVKEYRAALSLESADKVITRNQAAYYIGRLETPEATKTLSDLDIIENSISVKLSLGFGLVKNGSLEKENELYGRLSSDIDWDRANRGYHLLYYQDCHITTGPPFYDPEDVAWSRTLKALLSHIMSDSPRHLILSRIELFTIKRFIETRKDIGNLSLTQLDQIGSHLNMIQNVISLEYYHQTVNEFDKLKATWRTYAVLE